MKVKIECPFCGEKYEVEESQLDGYGTMTCGKCDGEFTLEKTPPAPPDDTPKKPLPPIAMTKDHDIPKTYKAKLPPFSDDDQTMEKLFDKAITILCAFQCVTGIGMVLGTFIGFASGGDGAAFGIAVAVSGAFSLAIMEVAKTVIRAFKHTCEAEICSREYQRQMIEILHNKMK